ncbi:MAG: alpha-amylase family glycosyl hydrolase [Desulfomonilia bacterium]
MFEFHISRESRDRYQFDETLFSLSGNVVFADYSAALRFSERMNQSRNAAAYPERSVSPAEIYAMGLIDEILHFIVELYRRTVKPTIISDAYSWTQSRVGDVDSTLEHFVDLFPRSDVYRGEISPQAYIRTTTDMIPNTHISLEEMLMLSLANENPAFHPYRELFDDSILEKQSRYPEILKCLEEFFSSQPSFGPYGQTLLDLLRAPARAAPNSLFDQLEYIRTHWGPLLGEMLLRILKGMDFIREERKQHFTGPGPTRVPWFGLKDLEDLERFSTDIDWMSRLVLIAKSIHVWLYQLSRKYGRSISRLDQIPDEELEILARWGVTGLWLIGIWERSPASRRIKQLTGNPEALPSAYSIYDYTIAHDLGGDHAFENLQHRALRYGIRMATDMVPNHTGIYSRWVIEHPEWYIQLDHSPFPSYRFTGENLSGDDRVEIKIEDGYWDRRDAAVVFRWMNRQTGDARYIYHGNDGTSMPWNDTAQLDFLKQEVRDAVIDKTIDIARRFSIIRFDAAMTLAKRHFQRLWYPLPGYGGDIPSRASHSVSPQEFEQCFPVEFWRELVDRLAQEVPNTLLLAEAFWLMEGYFVRSLGMHRVYNSAFMNMLKAEENSKYRDVMKNVLRFNPEILRRFVNFMNNPDEESAVTQFGKGDKYFGVATLMVTLPGLPMFGHGQVEGFSEKYGMEYSRSYWDEGVDHDLVKRHEEEIFPLLKERFLFSGVENFVLYDVVMPSGHVNEDVFAYSNRSGEERALVVYNNRYAQASGFIRRSVGIRTDRGKGRKIHHRTLAQGLDLREEDALFYIFRDFRSRLEFIRSSCSLARDGLFVHLDAYQANVFMNFREVRDHDGQLARLEKMLDGRGTEDVLGSLQELYLEKVRTPFLAIVNPDSLREIVGKAGPDDAFRHLYLSFLGEAYVHAHSSQDLQVILQETETLLSGIFRLQTSRRRGRQNKTPERDYLYGPMPSEFSRELDFIRIPLLWGLVCRLGMLTSEREVSSSSRALMNEWMLDKAIRETLKSLGTDQGRAGRELLMIRVLTAFQDWDDALLTGEMKKTVRNLFSDGDVRSYLGVNLFQDRWWFNRESMEELLYWFFYISRVRTTSGVHVVSKGTGTREYSASAYRVIATLERIAGESGYDVHDFLERVDRSPDIS